MNGRIFILICALGWPAGLTMGQPFAPKETLSATVPVSESIRKITGAKNGFSVVERVVLVHALDTNLPAADLEGLIGYLAAPLVAGENPGEIHWLKNEVMDRLLVQLPPLARLPRALTAIYRDEKQDAVIRDYALQHVAECRWDAAALGEARQTLWQATAETNDTLAGTALLGLTRIYEEKKESTERLRNTALAVVGNSQYSEASRLTALSLCGQLGEPRGLPLAVALAESRQSMVLRLAAVGVLGKLGGEPELAVLARLDSASEPRLLPAVRQARKVLEVRLKRNGDQK